MDEIEGVATQGQEANYWFVRKFTLSFSLDGAAWFNYTENGLGTKVRETNILTLSLHSNYRWQFRVRCITSQAYWLYQLSWKWPPRNVTSWKADVSSVSPSSEGMWFRQSECWFGKGIPLIISCVTRPLLKKSKQSLRIMAVKPELHVWLCFLLISFNRKPETRKWKRFITATSKRTF